MILELVVTCFLGAGWTYTAPQGWRIEQVGIQGTRNVCSGNQCLSIMVYPIEQSYVRLRRSVTAGERIEAPEGCRLEIEAPKDAEGQHQ